MWYPFLTSQALLWALSSAQFFPPIPSGLTVLESKLRPGVSISYKETHICETTPGVHSYSGYIHFPSSTISDVQAAEPFNVSLFFWYFESRNDPRNSPLSIYLGGGPGTSSLTGAIHEGGPCIANPDSNSTTLNEWSMNNHVNLLYIDQPVQVGYSYNDLVNVTMNLLTSEVTPYDPEKESEIKKNPTVAAGTLPIQNVNSTANTTVLSSKMLWHFSQVFFSEFPEYDTTDSRVSVWTNSYGGFWGPGFVSYILEQNERIKNGTIDDPKAIPLQVDTLGITNGCIDSALTVESYPNFAYNNTYGYKGIPEEIYDAAINNITKPGGCRDMTLECRAQGKIGDPHELGNNDTVNQICAAATQYCFGTIQGAFQVVSGRNAFDIAQDILSPFPTDYSVGFFNQHWVQEDLGVPVNWTISSNLIVESFFSITGDPFRRTIDPLNYVAQKGVKIALVFGDRDYRCNWLGGETISLALSYPEAQQFKDAGYESIKVNSSYEGGVVRQHNGVSFSRVFQAGHAVAAYQPETVYQIFNRAMFDTDIATGKVNASSSTIREYRNYSSTGPASSFSIKQELPKGSPNICYVWSATITCTEEQLEALAKGTAIIKDYVVIGIANGTSTPSANATSTSGPHATTTNFTSDAGSSAKLGLLMRLAVAISTFALLF